jgi:hypothetical protein
VHREQGAHPASLLRRLLAHELKIEGLNALPTGQFNRLLRAVADYFDVISKEYHADLCSMSKIEYLILTNSLLGVLDGKVLQLLACRELSAREILGRTYRDCDLNALESRNILGRR